MTKLYGAGVFLLGVSSVIFVGYVIYIDYRSTYRKKSKSNGTDWSKEDWPDYDEYLKDLNE